jgi:cysteine sulfinate desulfinase/cysteine desulfurase-like protein
MDVPPELLQSTLRLSVGIDNTPHEIDQAVRIIARITSQLRTRPTSDL